MADDVRRLLPSGAERFREFIAAARGGSAVSPPVELLHDPATSEPLGVGVRIENRKFSDRYEFGSYLLDALAVLERRQISRDAGLWTWLALYFVDQLCPPRSDGTREPLSDQAYVLPEKYNFRTYYRHLVRTPWLVCADHGEYARVLLIPASDPAESPLSVRGEIVEQLASRQAVLGSRTIIRAVHEMYFDPVRGRPRRGAAGQKGGSPRRLALVLQQLDLTFDLNACSESRVIELLPREFDRWAPAASGSTPSIQA
jgi:hypothetical protein